MKATRNVYVHEVFGCILLCRFDANLIIERMDIKIVYIKKAITKLMIVTVLVYMVGMPIQNSGLANELAINESTISDGTITNEDEAIQEGKSSIKEETNTSNLESMESETTPTSEVGAKSTLLDESTRTNKEMNTSESKMEGSLDKTESSKAPNHLEENNSTSNELSSTGESRGAELLVLNLTQSAWAIIEGGTLDRDTISEAFIEAYFIDSFNNRTDIPFEDVLIDFSQIDFTTKGRYELPITIKNPTRSLVSSTTHYPVYVYEDAPNTAINFFAGNVKVSSILPAAIGGKKAWDSVNLTGSWNPGIVKVPVDKLPLDPVKQGYLFKGWADSNGNLIDFATATVDLNSGGNINFEATFEKKAYIVTFDIDGKKETQKVLFEDLIKEPEAPKKEGHKFVGWYTSPQTKGTKWDFKTMGMPANHLTLYAKFTKLSDSGSDSGGSGTPSKPISPEKPGNKESTSDFTSNTGSMKITSQENTIIASPTMQPGGKLAKLGESSSLFLQGFGLLMLISGMVFFWKKRKKTHS
ncbi:LPXTG cell wall anchor domain-containing protein [Listeria monocytogenes]|nr:LPXTG cell wall anchor domain-containing protein [Listeria monocytogenes]